MSVKDFLISPTSEMIKDSTLDDIEFNDEGKEGEMADNNEDDDKEPFENQKETQFKDHIILRFKSIY